MSSVIPLFAIEQTACEGEYNEVVRHECEVYVPEIVRGLLADGVEGPFNSLDEITAHCRDYDVPFYNLITKEALKAQRDDEERRELESYVSDLCARKGIDPCDTDAVFTALRDVEAQVQDRQYGMREDGLCCSGGISEAWFDDFNYLSSKANEADRAFDWLAEYAPLAYARWSERHLGGDDTLED